MGVSQRQKEAFQCLTAQPAAFVMCFCFFPKQCGHTKGSYRMEFTLVLG